MIRFAPPEVHRHVQRLVCLLVVLMVPAFALACGGGNGDFGQAAPTGPPVIWGYVWVDDTTKAVGASVFTDPVSEVVVTDTAGFFEIKAGLQPIDGYEVEADLNGVQGKRLLTQTLAFETGPVHIVLGWEAEWILDNGGMGEGVNTTRPPTNAKVRRYSGH